MEALYFGHDALTRQSETLCRSKYASQTLTRAGRSPPKWINQTKEPRDPRAALAWKKHREAAWNSSVRTYAPLCFKGLKPITMEPWACDAILYECDVDRIGGRQSQDIQAWMLQESLGYGEEWTSQASCPTPGLPSAEHHAQCCAARSQVPCRPPTGSTTQEVDWVLKHVRVLIQGAIHACMNARRGSPSMSHACDFLAVTLERSPRCCSTRVCNGGFLRMLCSSAIAGFTVASVGA